MRIVIRADSGSHIGSGHVMRCLTLANALKLKGAEVSFVCRAFPKHMGEIILANGHQLYLLAPPTRSIKTRPNPKQTPPHATWLGESWETDLAQTQEALSGKYYDWLIIDHYSLDKRWERPMRKIASKVFVIDDLADREHDCELLLDQNLYENMESRYNELIPPACVKYLGPKYSLLRPEFRESRKHIRKRNGTIERILIFFGGSDPSNETVKALKSIELLDKQGIIVDVVVGEANPLSKKIQDLCNSLSNTNVHCQIKNISELMANADLSIGAGGSVTWERCAMGLPALV